MRIQVDISINCCNHWNFCQEYTIHLNELVDTQAFNLSYWDELSFSFLDFHLHKTLQPNQRRCSKGHGQRISR